MSQFTHRILTAFNVPVLGRPGMRREWLVHRFDLFERFCLPSVRAQTCTDFRWIVYFDAETPAEFRGRIEGYAEWERFETRFVASLAETLAPPPATIEGGAPYLITTTLDNDDAVARDFVERVQGEFRGQEFELVDFVEGFRLDLLRGKLYRHRVSSSPFISLFEKNEAPRTIRGCGPHDHLIRRFGAVREVESEPMWVQVIHDRNIAATGLWGCRRVPLDAPGDRFGFRLATGAARESGASIAAENVRRGLEAFAAKLLSRERRAALRETLRRWR